MGLRISISKKLPDDHTTSSSESLVQSQGLGSESWGKKKAILKTSFTKSRLMHSLVIEPTGQRITLMHSLPIEPTGQRITQGRRPSRPMEGSLCLR